jgi:CheY-like chemotaxis protein
VSADRNILLVDDDEDVRTCLRLILEDEGYAVEEAGDGPTALERLRRTRADLLLVDYRMPGMNAPTLLELARAENLVRCPVLLITAIDDPGDARARTNADAILAKPFQLDELLQVVADRLRP